MNPILEEWLSPASLGYLSECLQACRDIQMIADLRSFCPALALLEASKRLSRKKCQEIKAWVLELNEKEGAAA